MFPPYKLIDLAGPLQVLEDANRHLGEEDRYDVEIYSERGGVCKTDTVAQVTSAPWRDAKAGYDTCLLIGNASLGDQEGERRLMHDAIARSKRIGAVCVASFGLARIDLLDGLKAVTHWQDLDRFEEDFPNVQVQRDAIFVNEGNIWTCGGVTSGIDMALAMVAEDHGKAVAMLVARGMVVYMVRPGGQNQFSAPLQMQDAEASSVLEELAVWVRENIKEDLSVATLAARCRMSSRTFARRFKQEFNHTPARYVELCRLEKARELLETSDLPIKQIAVASGFLETVRLRRSFQATYGVTPARYRDHFSVL